MPPSRPVSPRRDACGPPQSPNRVARHPLIAGKSAIVRNLNEMRHGLASIRRHTIFIGSTGDGRPPPRRSKRRTETLGQKMWRSSSPTLRWQAKGQKRETSLKFRRFQPKDRGSCWQARPSFRSGPAPSALPPRLQGRLRTGQDGARKPERFPPVIRCISFDLSSLRLIPAQIPGNNNFIEWADGPTTDKTNQR